MSKLATISACLLFLAVGLQNISMQPLDIVDNHESNVKITLFYESLCPYSIRFIVQQLYPVAMEYGKYMSFDLVPFGHSYAKHKKDGSWDFKCQHGAAECYGNRVHACVLEQGKTKNQDKTIEVLACLMNFNYTDAQIEKCLRKSKFDYYRHTSCMKSKATELEVAYGQRTMANKPPVNYVPFLMFNGVYNNTVEDLATTHLDYVVCSLIDSNERPETCPNLNYT